MKKLLLLLLCALSALTGAAQNGITISDFSAKAGSSTTLTFKVSWMPLTSGKLWSDTAWVFVDYNAQGTMNRLQLSGGTLTDPSWDGATVIKIDGNDNGVQVVGNARTSGTFSATVHLLTATADLHGLCIYAINYPPAVEFVDNEHAKFRGTPPFMLTYDDGTQDILTQTQAQNIVALTTDKTLASFTDASLAPVKYLCAEPAIRSLEALILTYCVGMGGVTLSLDDTDDGAMYQLYETSSGLIMATVTGNGNAIPFPGKFKAGTYSAKTARGVHCARNMGNSLEVAQRPYSAGLIRLTAGGCTTTSPGRIGI
jgi:hypothetical protein